MKRILYRLFIKSEIFFSPFVYLAAKFLGVFRWIGVANLPFCKKALLNAGVFPIRNHYYEPLFDTRHLKNFEAPRNLPAIQFQLDTQIQLLKKISYPDELQNIPLKSNSDVDFYQRNNFFEGGEADCWYGMIRHFKPKKIIEIGCGHSTKLTALALSQNHLENVNYKCTHFCIEPYENPWLGKLNVQLIRQPVESMDLKFFQQLEKNDFLFIDSSHVIRPQGDVLFEYSQILPSLNSGVIVHIHDIYTPYDYPEQWVAKDIRLWNEQYLLEAFIAGNSEWGILLSCFHLFKDKFNEFRKCCPLLSELSEPSSFYIQKK